jgi:(p)ppGpp synthase/HD superfamily hydrolase
MLFVHDTNHLDQLIAKLKKVDGVVKVDRFDT